MNSRKVTGLAYNLLLHSEIMEMAIDNSRLGGIRVDGSQGPTGSADFHPVRNWSLNYGVK